MANERKKLNLVITPTRLDVIADIRTAYILAGSFVGFLIERYGLSRFKKLLKQEFESFKQLGNYTEEELNNFIDEQ